MITKIGSENLRNLEEIRALIQGVIDLVKNNIDEILARRFDINIKPDNSPVTAADLFIENLIHCYLVERVPGIVLVSEEMASNMPEVTSEGYYAILDPIDGTENFCSGLKEWGVSLTLWHGAFHLGSLLYMPELNQSLMTGDTLIPVRSRIRGFSSSFCPEILQGISEPQESRIMGCAVYNLFNVIRGSFARFSNPCGAYAWDLLPGLMLAREHHCIIEVEGEPYYGKFLRPSGKYRIDIWHRYDLHNR